MTDAILLAARWMPPGISGIDFVTGAARHDGGQSASMTPHFFAAAFSCSTSCLLAPFAAEAAAATLFSAISSACLAAFLLA
jgi:hypothetical protein